MENVGRQPPADNGRSDLIPYNLGFRTVVVVSYIPQPQPGTSGVGLHDDCSRHISVEIRSNLIVTFGISATLRVLQQCMSLQEPPISSITSLRVNARISVLQGMSLLLEPNIDIEL